MALKMGRAGRRLDARDFAELEISGISAFPVFKSYSEDSI